MKNKDLSSGELRHEKEIAKIPMNQKKPNSMGNYFTADGGSQVGFNFHKKKKKKKR